MNSKSLAHNVVEGQFIQVGWWCPFGGRICPKKILRQLHKVFFCMDDFGLFWNFSCLDMPKLNVKLFRVFQCERICVTLHTKVHVITLFGGGGKLCWQIHNYCNIKMKIYARTVFFFTLYKGLPSAVDLHYNIGSYSAKAIPGMLLSCITCHSLLVSERFELGKVRSLL